MKIRNDENLQRLAEVAGVAPKTMSKRIASNLIKYDETIDDDSYWQSKISELFSGDTPICNIAKILDKCGIKYRTEETVDAFFNCIIMGDGDCPECGGNLDYEENGHYLDDGDYYTPPTWVVDEYICTCSNCGYKRISHEEF